MEKYENLGLVGEGSYGMVMKCRHKESGQLVAIKKFLESEEDKTVKKIATREIKMLKALRHENLVNLIEYFRRKRKLYLVFEFVDHTVLDDLERYPNGLEDQLVRKITYQVLRAIEFCHHHNIIHRDIKPENILVSKMGIVKLCDFGFARTLAGPGEIYTDYVATRWYRAPELLVGDANYGKAVDVWAIGCLVVEMLTGNPLFPGDSDIDQLYHITSWLGNLSQRYKEIFMRNPIFVGMKLPEVHHVEPLEKRLPQLPSHSINLVKVCLKLDANDRPTCSELLSHGYFNHDNFAHRFVLELRTKIGKEFGGNALLQNKKPRVTNHKVVRSQKENVNSKEPKQPTIINKKQGHAFGRSFSNSEEAQRDKRRSVVQASEQSKSQMKLPKQGGNKKSPGALEEQKEMKIEEEFEKERAEQIHEYSEFSRTLVLPPAPKSKTSVVSGDDTVRVSPLSEEATRNSEDHSCTPTNLHLPGKGAKSVNKGFHGSKKQHKKEEFAVIPRQQLILPQLSKADASEGRQKSRGGKLHQIAIDPFANQNINPRKFS